MRVISALTMLAIFFFASSFTEHPRTLRAKKTNLIIRQIGDKLLLQAGDSTSRVMPVTESNEGTFLLRFENEFVFSHDSLIALSQRLLPKNQYASGYTVTVHDCLKGYIIYGFQVNATSPDILACKGRKQPAGCYTIEFAFADFYKNIKQKKADIEQRPLAPTPVNVEPHTHAGVKSPAAAPQNIVPKVQEMNTATLDYTLINVVAFGMVVLLGLNLLIRRYQNRPILVPVKNQQIATVKELLPELPALGKFLFDVKGQALHMEGEVINLTDKECKVLVLLHRSFGELIARDTLMQEVWINEGVITGRSLDMFVSKLRKKLSRDPELRITNVHGKGYKLEIPETFVANS